MQEDGGPIDQGEWQKGQDQQFKQIDCTNKKRVESAAFLQLTAWDGQNKLKLVGRLSLRAACIYKSATFFLAPPGQHVPWAPYKKDDQGTFQRVGHQTTLLPDGRLLLTGGSKQVTIQQASGQLRFFRCKAHISQCSRLQPCHWSDSRDRRTQTPHLSLGSSAARQDCVPWWPGCNQTNPDPSHQGNRSAFGRQS